MKIHLTLKTVLKEVLLTIADIFGAEYMVNITKEENTSEVDC